MQKITINIFSIVGSPFCVNPEDGRRIYDLLQKALKKGCSVNLSFRNADFITTHFLDTAVGQLFREFSLEDIKKNLEVSFLSHAHRALLKRVVNNAILYYKYPERIRDSINELSGEVRMNI